MSTREPPVIFAVRTACTAAGTGSAADAVIAYFNDLPEMMRASLAWDQGSEMAQHAKVSLATDMPVYFTDPHSPWQRPSTETPPRTALSSGRCPL